jgi:hypothetical protein
MTLREAQIVCDSHLQEMEKCFRSHVKLTFIARNPESDDGDLILTRDDLELVEIAIRKLRDRETQA